jgi:exopolysaccharide biosynthesis polyprenyl glycosylphosphotransferase
VEEHVLRRLLSAKEQFVVGDGRTTAARKHPNVEKMAFLESRQEVMIPAMRNMPDAPLEFDLPEPGQGIRTDDWRRRYTAAGIVVDLVAASVATELALLVRFGGTPPEVYIKVSLALAPLWVVLIAMNRAYEHRFIGVGTEEFGRVLRAGVMLMSVIAFASYATNAELVRGYVIIAVPALVVSDLLGRRALRAWLHQQRVHGRCVQRTLLVGSATTVQSTAHRMRGHSNHGMTVVGACVSDGAAGKVAADLGVPVVGNLTDIQHAVLTTNADIVTVLPSALLSGDEIRRLAWSLESTGTELVVCSGLTEIAGARITIRPVANSPLLHVTCARLSGPSRMAKAIFDRGVALLGLILIAPALLVIAVRIATADRGAPLFRQTRVGLNGREFTLYKFRTMVPEAEARKGHLAGRNEHDGPLFKMARDPRVTPVGRRLRRYSLDELPQLINVVRGEMSLVGPRPPLPEEVAEYGDDMRRRLLVKPGLTGLWQVSGRSDLSWADSELLDLRYVENWSLGYDLLILWRTARAVIVGSGAY